MTHVIFVTLRQSIVPISFLLHSQFETSVVISDVPFPHTFIQFRLRLCSASYANKKMSSTALIRNIDVCPLDLLYTSRPYGLHLAHSREEVISTLAVRCSESR